MTANQIAAFLPQLRAMMGGLDRPNVPTDVRDAALRLLETLEAWVKSGDPQHG